MPLTVVTEPVTATLEQATEVSRLDVASRHERALAILAQHDSEALKARHASEFFRDIQYTNPSNSQQMKGVCICCCAYVASTGSSRFVGHLCVCALVPGDVRLAFQKVRGDSTSKSAAKRDALVLAEEEAASAAKKHASEQAKLKQVNIKSSLQSGEVVAADEAIANFFYANGISFSAASSEETSLYRQMIRAIQAAPIGYVPPNPKKLGGELLDQCYNAMWQRVRARDPDGTLKTKFGSTYVSDGWDSCDHLPLINSAFISANDGGLYWRSVDTSGKVKSAEYCAMLMIQDIYAYGPENVVLVVTDTCATMVKAWALVEDEFPWISVMCCQPHVISLLLKDIGKDKHVDTTINDEATVVSWFANHQFPLAKLREITVQKLGKAKELVRAAATRFGSNTLVGERLLELKASLQATVVDAEYAAKNYKDAANTEEATGTGKTVRSNKGATTKKLVLDDEGFWDRVTTHVTATKPLVKMLRRFDTSAPAIGKIYSSWFEAGQHLQDLDAPYQSKAVDKHAERWAYGHSPIIAAGYVLDPEFIDHEQSANTEVTEGFMTTVEKIGILRNVRGRIDHFRQLWKERRLAIGDDPSMLASYDKFPVYPTAKDPAVKTFCSTVNQQLTLYRSKKGMFAREWVMDNARDMPAYLWWDANGASCPELQYIARLVLAQPASASICERINSEFAFVKDKRRNRLAHTRANKLVALFHNLRLSVRMRKCTYSEPAVGWNDEDDHTGVMKYGVAHYESTAKLQVKAPVQRPTLPAPEEMQPEEVLMLM